MVEDGRVWDMSGERVGIAGVYLGKRDRAVKDVRVGIEQGNGTEIDGIGYGAREL